MKNKSNYLVYKAINIKNKKIYVGKTKNLKQRQWQHKVKIKNLTNKPFYNDLRKYGWNNFKWNIIMSNLTEKEAYDLEIKTIKKYNRKQLYNLTDGGRGNSINWWYKENFPEFTRDEVLWGIYYFMKVLFPRKRVFDTNKKTKKYLEKIITVKRWYDKNKTFEIWYETTSEELITHFSIMFGERTNLYLNGIKETVKKLKIKLF